MIDNLTSNKYDIYGLVLFLPYANPRRVGMYWRVQEETKLTRILFEGSADHGI